MDALLKALAKATGSMKRLSKDSRNIEQKYDFTSIDDFLAMVGPIYAENGLTTMIDETDVAEFERQGKYGVNYWLRVRFSFTTYHESGQSLPMTHRTVEVIRTGAQSFGSAQSYALKQYLRGLHMIPTGDKDDADFADKGDGKPVMPVDEKPRGPSAMEVACTSLGNADTLDQLAAIWKDLPRSVQEDDKVLAAKEAAKDRFKKQNADLDGDSIPYEGPAK